MNLSDFTDVREIVAGWSDDQKYHVRDRSGRELLLRLSPADRFEKRKRAFDIQTLAALQDVPAAKPVDIGRFDDGRVYTLEEWVEGVQAEERIPQTVTRMRYFYGLHAGSMLRLIHTVPAPEDTPDWQETFGAKIDRVLKAYADCPLKYERGNAFVRYILINRHLIKNRPICAQHGDFHTGNLLIEADGRLRIIDFDRADYGDPWEEFNRMHFSVRTSALFASGLVDGYFGGEEIPPLFWRILALYESVTMLGSLPWALRYGDEDVATMTELADYVLDWHQEMRSPKPSWYTHEFGRN